MKKLLIGATLGCIIGAGAFVGLAQIPNVRDLVLKQDTSSSSSVEVNDLKQENSTLKTQVDMLNADLTTTKSKLSDTESALTLKEQEVSTLTSEKIDLQSRLDDANAEIESLKGLVGSDTSQLLETINSLTNQLNAKTQELNTATVELEQLRVDKETLTTRVSELEIRLAEVEEELANYKSLGDIDILKIENYNGTWYKDGKFEDLYTITNGNVVHNQNEDTGHLVCMYNQMYLSMVSGGYVPVTLSLDGNSFTTEDGKTYSKFYINTFSSTLSSYGDFIGTYNCDTEIITINVDNTLIIKDGEETYYGAYTVSAEERNVGGNIQITNYITATINVDDCQEVRRFSLISGSVELVDCDSDLLFSKINTEPLLVARSNYTPPTSNYLKVVVRTVEPIRLKPGSSLSVLTKGVTDSYTSYGYVNGVVTGNSGNGSYIFDSSVPYSGSIEFYGTDFVFYFTHNNANCYQTSFMSIGGVGFKVLSVEKFGTFYGLSSLQAKIGNDTVNYVPCSTIDNYTNGTYELSDSILELTSDGATITPTDSDSITATSYSVTAKTDGFDIYQTATITYVATELVEEVETEVTHTIVINYKNNNVLSSTIDGVESEIIKN